MSEKQIYFIRPVGKLSPIKIGCSKFPKGRLEALSIQSPLRLEIIAMVPGGHPEERRLHGMFAEHWLHHEWFAASKELLALLDYVVANGCLPALPEGKIIKLPRPKRRRNPSGPRNPSRRTIEIGKKALAEYEAGARLVPLAQKYQVAPVTMRDGLVAAGASIRRYTTEGPSGPRDIRRAEAFRDRYLAGDTLEEIAKDYGVTRERVRQILRKFNVPSLGIRAEHRSKPAPVTEQEREIARLYVGGTSPKEIMQRFPGVHLSHVLRRTGTPAKGLSFWRTLPDDAEVTAKIADLYKNGHSAAAIAQMLSPRIKYAETVYRYLKKAGVEPRYEHGAGRRLNCRDRNARA